MDAYYRALEKTIKPGMRVLDAGSGTGILGLMALKLGAQSVTCVDVSSIVNVSENFLKKNAEPGSYRIIQKELREIKGMEFDVVVGELLSHFGFEEDSAGIYSSLKKNLAGKPVFIPSGLELYCNIANISRFTDDSLYKSTTIDYTEIIKEYCQFPEYIKSSEFRNIADDQLLYSSPLTEFSLPSVLRCSIELPENTCFNAITTFFRAQLAKDVFITNSPDFNETHWMNIVFPVFPAMISGGRIEVELYPRSIGMKNIWAWKVTTGDQVCYADSLSQSQNSIDEILASCNLIRTEPDISYSGDILLSILDALGVENPSTDIDVLVTNIMNKRPDFFSSKEHASDYITSILAALNSIV